MLIYFKDEDVSYNLKKKKNCVVVKIDCNLVIFSKTELTTD